MKDLILNKQDLEIIRHEADACAMHLYLSEAKQQLKQGNRVLLKWPYKNVPDIIENNFSDEGELLKFWNHFFSK
jgi:hypothetical protein